MMPLYEYYDPETNTRIELSRPVADRNKDIVLKRASTVPEKISIHGKGPTAEQQFNNDVLRAYYKKEQKDGSRWQSAHSKAQVKEAWTK